MRDTPTLGSGCRKLRYSLTYVITAVPSPVTIPLYVGIANQLETEVEPGKSTRMTCGHPPVQPTPSENAGSLYRSLHSHAETRYSARRSGTAMTLIATMVGEVLDAAAGAKAKNISQRPQQDRAVPVKQAKNLGAPIVTRFDRSESTVKWTVEVWRIFPLKAGGELQ